MRLCNGDVYGFHGEICYLEKDCPLCNALKDLENTTIERDNLLTYIEHLEKDSGNVPEER